MAGFQVIISGRFWVFTEGQRRREIGKVLLKLRPAVQQLHVVNGVRVAGFEVITEDNVRPIGRGPTRRSRYHRCWQAIGVGLSKFD